VSVNGKKKSRKKTWVILGIVVLLGVLVVANLAMKRKPKGQKVDVAVAKLDSLVQTVSASGKIQPKVEVNISANVSGRILYLGADEGDKVTKGQLLVKIEDETYNAQLQQMRYALMSTQASLDEAQSQLRRTMELYDANLSSDAELEAKQAAVRRFEADVERLKANVTQAEDNLRKTRIYSPIDGIVTRLNKEIGEMAIGATFSEDVILVVSKLDQMEVNVEVNENDVILVALGDPVKIEVFAIPDTSFRGTVTEIAHSGIVRGQGSAEEVTNFEVTVAVNDFVPELRPGMSATVEIETDRRDRTLVLPQEAVTVRSLKEEKKIEKRTLGGKKGKGGRKKGDGGERSSGMRPEDEPVEVVFVVKNDTAWVRPVKLGIYSDTHFEILSGIEDGDIVVSGPFRLLSRELHSGTRVEYTAPEQENGDEEPAAEVATTGDGEKGETTEESQQ